MKDVESRGRAEIEARAEVIATARRMNVEGINQGTAGNVSVRWRQGYLITPTGVPYDALDVADVVFMNASGQPSGRLAPSSEWRFHLDIYRERHDAGAIVHTHSVHATAVAAHRRAIPAFHYMVALGGGSDIRCSTYQTFGTQELSDAVIEALDHRGACLVANHGVVALGADLVQAFRLASEVETLAQMYTVALQLGEPIVLDELEMHRVLERFARYGQRE